MSVTNKLFEKYHNPVFIETGSCNGDGIQLALGAGFKTIYSIELAPDKFKLCVNRFKDNKNVYLVFGDSRIVLKEVLDKIQEPVTFWLDAHYYEESVCSLPEEIKAISNHDIKTHTIMIDDLRDLGKYNMGLSIEVLKEKILLINSDYMFNFEDGYTVNDILIAKTKINNINYPQFEDR